MRKQKSKTQTLLKTKQIHVKIILDHYSEVTREADPDDEWDCDDIQHTYDVRGYEIVTEHGREWDFIFKDIPKDPMYLVFARYGTGDSFHSESGLFQEIFLTPHYADALAIKNALDSDAKKNSEKFNPIVIKLPVAKENVTLSTSTWKGYFESLESINVEMVHKLN